MRASRWIKGLVLLTLLHLPVLAAALYYTRSGRIAGMAGTPPVPAATRMAAAAPPPAPAPRVLAPVGLTPVALPGGPAAPPEREVVSLPPPPVARPAGTPSPLEQNAAGKEFIEGHWLGLEVIPLSPELAREYRIPDGEQGILVDEITLEAAESGILAGDLVQAIEGHPTPDLRQFFLATRKVQQRSQATVEVRRQGRPLSFTMRARNAPELGLAQMEAAQPIPPGAISPHRSRHRACTDCHVIMESGGQLPTDQGDILPTPGAIQPGATAPHRYRGPCSSCHRITP